MKSTCIILIWFIFWPHLHAKQEADQTVPENGQIEFREQVNFMGWPNCLKLSNQSIEMIITTDVGPRILYFGFIGGPNMFYVDVADTGKTGGDEWRLYGGHRFWLSPEIMPRTYAPDNTPVSYCWNGEILTLTQDLEQLTATVKEISIRLYSGKNQVDILHRLTNKGSHNTEELALWGISACAGGSWAIVPQEPCIDPAEFLLPVRSLAIWGFTRMDDPRYCWGEKYILARQSVMDLKSETKIGMLNKQKWAACVLDTMLFIKTFDFDPDLTYPDYGCNNEIYMNGKFLEVESLGPLTKIKPKSTIEHIEHWTLYRTEINSRDDEERIQQELEPVLNLSKNP